MEGAACAVVEPRVPSFFVPSEDGTRPEKRDTGVQLPGRSCQFESFITFCEIIMTDFYTIEETAELFRCGTRTIRRAIRSGRLAAAKPFGTWLVPASEVDRLTSPAEKPRPKVRTRKQAYADRCAYELERLKKLGVVK